MNILILSGETAAAITAKQSCQHRLAPAPLTDGRYFLSADVLTEPRFAAHLDGVDYQTATLEDVREWLPASEDEDAQAWVERSDFEEGIAES